MVIKMQSVKLKLREHLEDPEVDGTIFKWRLERSGQPEKKK